MNGIKDVIKKCAEKMGDFEEVGGDDTSVLPSLPQKETPICFSDMLALLWGTMGLFCLGYAMGLMK